MTRAERNRTIYTRTGEPIAIACACGWRRTILTHETPETARAAHERATIHRIATNENAGRAPYDDGPDR